MGVPQDYGSCQQTRSSMASSLHRVTDPARSLLQCSRGQQAISTCSSMEPCVGCRMDICSTLFLHGLQKSNLHHQGLHHGLQGNLLWCLYCLLSPPFRLGDCVVVSPIYSHSSLTGTAHWLLPFFKYVFTEVQSTLLTGSALAIGRSVLERGGTGSA